MLRPFIAENDPYAGGQHRGIDIGAPSEADVRAPATGVVSFAGRLPHEGLCLTIRTQDGYSVTLVHLGSIGLPVGTAVVESEVVGTIGPSGEPEGPEPYVHLGVRLTADPNGYVDPLSLLPVREGAPQEPSERQPAAQPAAPLVIPAPGRPRRVRVSAPSSRVRTAPRIRSPRSIRPFVEPRSSQAPPVSRARARGRGHSLRPNTKRRVEGPTSKSIRTRQAGEPPSVRPRERPRRHEVVAGSPTPRSESSVDRSHQFSRRALLFPLGALGLALIAIGAMWRKPAISVPARSGFARQPLRKMSHTEPAPEERLARPQTTESSDRRRVAVRERTPTSRPCGRLRRALRHHGSVSPASRRSSADGQRHRRARNASHGRRRPRRSVSA